MTFTPVNNYLYVRTIKKDETEEASILLPQDYQSVESPYGVVEVLGCSGESGTLWGTGLHLVVEATHAYALPTQRRDLHGHQGKPRNRYFIG